MIVNKISDVVILSHQRPRGYVEDVKAHCFLWDTNSGIYKISEEMWKKLCNKYRSGVRPNGQIDDHFHSPDKCKFAVPDCCGKPHICSMTMGDCPDHFDKDCKIRLKYKG